MPALPLISALWPDTPGMVEVESATDLLECRGVEANASSRLVAAGTGEVREDVGKLGDPLTDNFLSRADGSTGRFRSPGCASRGSSPRRDHYTGSPPELGIDLLDLCHLDGVSGCWRATHHDQTPQGPMSTGAMTIADLCRSAAQEHKGPIASPSGPAGSAFMRHQFGCLGGQQEAILGIAVARLWVFPLCVFI